MVLGPSEMERVKCTFGVCYVGYPHWLTKVVRQETETDGLRSDAGHCQVRFGGPDYLSAGRPEDGDGFDWQVFGLEAQLGGGERRD